MHAALYSAKTGLESHNANLANISNNLANVNTTGFKRGRVEFEDLFYQTLNQAGSQTTEETQSPSGITLGTGVKVAATKKIFSNGSQVQTGNPLDLAIDGQGFIQVTIPGNNEIGYTRAGNLQVNAEGQLVTSTGYVLQPPISIPQGSTAVSISSDGIVSVTEANGGTSEAGRIELANFINPAGLAPRGGNIFTETTASGQPQVGTPGADGLGRISQGSLEASNVNVVEELVDLIESQRAFEVTAKVVSGVDQMLQFVNQQI